MLSLKCSGSRRAHVFAHLLSRSLFHSSQSEATQWSSIICKPCRSWLASIMSEMSSCMECTRRAISCHSSIQSSQSLTSTSFTFRSLSSSSTRSRVSEHWSSTESYWWLSRQSSSSSWTATYAALSPYTACSSFRRESRRCWPYWQRRTTKMRTMLSALLTRIQSPVVSQLNETKFLTILLSIDLLRDDPLHRGWKAEQPVSQLWSVLILDATLQWQTFPRRATREGPQAQQSRSEIKSCQVVSNLYFAISLLSSHLTCLSH